MASTVTSTPTREPLPKLRANVVVPSPAHPANPHLLLESKRPEVSRFLKQARPDLLPRDDIDRVLLMPGDAVIELRSRCASVSDTASASRLSHTVSKSSAFLGRDRYIDLASQIVHTDITLARLRRSCKRLATTGFRRAPQLTRIFDFDLHRGTACSQFVNKI